MYYLPNDIIPKEYFLTFKPIERTIFSEAIIIVNVLKETNEIILHSSNLKYEKVQVIRDDEVTDIKDLNINKEDQEISFKFNFKIGEYQLKFNYYFSTSNSKFYHTKTGYLAHFEPDGARTAFPCYDEPCYKTPFTISVCLLESFDVFSNCPIKSVESYQDKDTENKKFKKVNFEKSCLMPTYLVACVIGQFDTYEEKVENILLRVCVPKGKLDESKYSFELGKQCITYFSKYVEQKFVLSKLDLVSVNEFTSFGTESFGCILFSQKIFLVNEKTSPEIKKRIARLLFHEISHQWTGNIVGIPWWSYLWVKEGFARFLEYYMIGELYPEWKYWDHFLIEIYNPVIMSDIETTHPVENSIAPGDNIKDIYDNISYGKGAIMLRMLFGYINQKLMWKSINEFINNYKFSVATSQDFWKSVSNATKLDVSSFMDKWIKITGYPIIICKNDELIFNQDLKIPMVLLIDGEEKSVLLESSPFKLEYKSKIKVNYKHYSYVRTYYSPDMIDKFDKLTSQDIIGIFIDSVYFLFLPKNDPTKLEIVDFIKILKLVLNYGLEYNQEFIGYMKTSLKKLIQLTSNLNFVNQLKDDLTSILENSKLFLHFVDLFPKHQDEDIEEDVIGMKIVHEIIVYQENTYFSKYK